MQNFASCSQLCRWRNACVARARRPAAIAASRCSMTAASLALRCGARLGSEPQGIVERHALGHPVAIDDDRGELAVRSDDDVTQRSDHAACALHRAAAQRTERERMRTVEIELVLLPQDERRTDHDL